MTTQTVNGSSVSDKYSILPEKLDISRSHDDLITDTLNLTLRSSLAREKRRKARDLSDSEMPPLNTLNQHELMEAVNSFPKSKSTNNVTGNAHLLKSTSEEKFSDDASDISALNKVHRVVKANGDTAFLPVAHVYFPDQQILDSGDPSEEHTSVLKNCTDISSGISPIAKVNMGKSNLEDCEPEKAVTDVANDQKAELNVLSTVEQDNPEVDGCGDLHPETNQENVSGEPQPETNQENLSNTVKPHSAALKKNTVSKKSKFCALL